MHWPQDSSAKKCWKFSATANMSWPGPKTMIEPPVARSPGDKVRSNSDGGTQVPLAPPTCTALEFSAPTSLRIWRSEVPKGYS